MFKNKFNGLNYSGTTLTDLVGTGNGTGAGTPAPSASTGNIKFSGGNGATAGDRCRIVLTESNFHYTYTGTFSILCYFKSSKLDAQYHTIFFEGSHDLNGLYGAAIGADEGLDIIILTSAGSVKRYINSTSVCDGKWHMIVMTYSTNDLKVYVDSNLVTLTTNDTFSTGNFYNATSNKICLGARWSNVGNNYLYDGTFELQEFYQFTHVLTQTEIKNYWNYLKGIYN